MTRKAKQQGLSLSSRNFTLFIIAAKCSNRPKNAEICFLTQDLKLDQINGQVFLIQETGPQKPKSLN